MVEGIRALYINGAPVLHTDVWFSYRGFKDKEEEEEEAKSSVKL
jgi:ornithine carbamoyltransferase